ncbi:hypothetical protein [Streptosporangium sp. NPDC051022]|uniref:hypothetical protein n=1 Tax=Streptosporangium sp. NPDC051022 TaxID=3155752 RepID=UPI00341B21DD
MAAPQLYMAPLGTNPADADAWTPIGTIAPLSYDLTPVGQESLGDWHAPGRASFSISCRVTISWRSHLWWFRTPHPAARRAKTEYHRRRR